MTQVGQAMTDDDARVIRHSIILRQMEKESIAAQSDESQRRRKEALRKWRDAVDRIETKSPP